MKTVKGIIIMLLLLSAAVVFANDMAVTIYNDNLALVRDSRNVSLEKGVKPFRFTNVASQIDATSVHFKAVSGNNSVNMLEQNYEYDLVGTNRLLEKYIDQNIVATIKDGGTINGTLLSAMGGDIIVQTSDGTIKALKSTSLESVEFPSLSDGLITRPTLVWLLDSPKTGDYNAQISYLTRGINWHAEYVAVVNTDDTALNMSGWVSVENNSGAIYENAKLKLVAGDVNIEQPESRRNYDRMAKADVLYAAAEPQFEEKSFFEYHLYTLQRPATIKDRQIKQLSLFPPAGADVKKIYTFNGNRQNKVNVTLEMKNSKDNGLGMPLPKGKIRVYKTDVDGSQEFIGEDTIDHTPKDETVRIYLGDAFDIVGERIVVDTKKIGRESRQQTVRIKLRNHKDEAVTVYVVENLWGDWEFIGDTPKISKKEAHKVEFEIKVPANGETQFEYTVLFK